MSSTHPCHWHARCTGYTNVSFINHCFKEFVLYKGQLVFVVAWEIILLTVCVSCLNPQMWLVLIKNTCKVWTELWSALPSNKSQFPVNGFSVPRKWLPSSQEMVSQFPGHGYLVPGEIPFWLTASHLLGYGFSVPRKLVSSSQFATEVLSSCSPPIWSRSRVPCFALALGFS